MGRYRAGRRADRVLRRDVHLIRDAVHARDLTAAVLYGALAPEVRRREAERFLSGLRRCGGGDRCDRHGAELAGQARAVHGAGEVRRIGRPAALGGGGPPIAGRAGRFGHFEVGEFGVIARNTPQALRTLLERPDLRLGPHVPLTVRPTRACWRVLRTIAALRIWRCCWTGSRRHGPAGSPYPVSELAPAPPAGGVAGRTFAGIHR